MGCDQKRRKQFDNLQELRIQRPSAPFYLEVKRRVTRSSDERSTGFFSWHYQKKNGKGGKDMPDRILGWGNSMSEDSKQFVYRRKKKVAILFDGSIRNYILIALSASNQEEASKEARRIQTEIRRLLPGMADSLRAAYLRQEKDDLVEAALEFKREEILHKAARTLLEDEPDYHEKLAAKMKVQTNLSRCKLAMLTKEQLVDNLVNDTINQQLANTWNSANLEATMVWALHGEDGRQLFTTVEELREALPGEVLVKLYEALSDCLSERGTAKDFARTLYFRRLDKYARRYGMTISEAMETDEFLMEAAEWGHYYEQAHGIVRDMTYTQTAGAPTQEIIDNPQLFWSWLEQCGKLCKFS
jgi:hypothetical protein